MVALAYAAHNKNPSASWENTGGGFKPGGVKYIIEEFALPTRQLQDDKDDVGDKYTQYDSRTKIGARNDTIIALYGQVSPYTEYRYWWLDSIQWQTIALCDKSGLRRKSTIPPKTKGKKKRPTNDELRNILGRFGLGTSESNEEKADRIRKELNKDGG